MFEFYYSCNHFSYCLNFIILAISRLILFLGSTENIIERRRTIKLRDGESINESNSNLT